GPDRTAARRYDGAEHARGEVGALRRLVRHFFDGRFARQIDAEEVVAIDVAVPALRGGRAGDEQCRCKDEVSEAHGWAPLVEDGRGNCHKTEARAPLVRGRG